MYLTHKEEKPVLAESFIRTLKNKNSKYMTSISKNVYINKLGDIVLKYNNAYHRTIEMKPVDVKSKTYMNFNKENNYRDCKFKADDYVRILKQKPFWKRLCSKEEAFVLDRVKILCPGHI